MDPEPRLPLSMRLLPRHWVVIDVWAALCYGLLAWGVFGHEADTIAVGLGGTVLASGSICSARRHPLPAFGAALAVLFLSTAAPSLGWVALAPMCFALYEVAVRCPLRLAAVVLAASMSGAVATALPRWEHTGAVVPFALAFVTAWVVGYAIGQRRAYTEELVRYHARLAAAEKDQARHAVVEERMRIARELHDVVAHSMSVITVQAGYGHLVADEQPAMARSALGAIETTGRQALAEMRQLLGVLRSEEPTGREVAPALEPSPGLRNLDELIERIAQAGVTVELEVSGDHDALPASTELTAYRIVQEALTNVVKHAGVTRASVTIDSRLDGLLVEVTDEGSGRGRFVTRDAGHGLTGMRERAGLCHGTLEAGPRPQGGYRVRARLPFAGVRT